MKNNWSLLKNDNLTALQGNKTDFYCSRQIKSLQLRTDNQTCADGAALCTFVLVSVQRSWMCYTPEKTYESPPAHTHTQLHPHRLYNNTPECESCGLKWKNGSKSENRQSQASYSWLPTITARIHVQAHVCMHTSQAEPSSSYSHQW